MFTADLESTIIDLYKLNIASDKLNVKKLPDDIVAGVKNQFDLIAKKFLPKLYSDDCDDEDQSACLKAGKKGDLFFNCYSCQTDPTCCMCGACFVSSEHIGHEYTWMTIGDALEEESICDCGDPEAWSSGHACSYHSAPKSVKSVTPITEYQEFIKYFLELSFKILSGDLASQIEGMTPEPQKACSMKMSDRVSMITEDKSLSVKLSAEHYIDTGLTGISFDCPYKNMVTGATKEINYSMVFCTQVLECLLDSLYTSILSKGSDLATFFGEMLCAYEIKGKTKEEDTTLLPYLLSGSTYYKDHNWARVLIQPDPWYRILLISLCSEPHLKDKLCEEVLNAYKSTLVVPKYALPIKTLPQMFTLQLFTVKSLQSKYFYRLSDLFNSIHQVDQYLSEMLYKVNVEAESGGTECLADKTSLAHKHVMDAYIILGKCLVFENLVFDDIQNMIINKATPECLEVLKSTDMLLTITRMASSHYQVIELLAILCKKADRYSQKSAESPSRKSLALGRIKSISQELCVMLENFIIFVDSISNFLIQDEAACLYATEYFIDKYFDLSHDLIKPMFTDPGFMGHVTGKGINLIDFKTDVLAAENKKLNLLLTTMIAGSNSSVKRTGGVLNLKNNNPVTLEFLHLCGVLQPISNMVMSLLSHGKSAEKILNNKNYKRICAIYSYKLVHDYTDVFLITDKVFKRSILRFDMDEETNNLKIMRSGDVLMGFMVSDNALLADLAAKLTTFNQCSHLQILGNLKFNLRLEPYLKVMMKVMLAMMGTRFSSNFTDVAEVSKSHEIVFRLVHYLRKGEVNANNVQQILTRISLSYPGERYSREEFMAHLKEVLTSVIPDLGEEDDFLKINIQHKTVKLCLPFCLPDDNTYVTESSVIPKYSQQFAGFLQWHNSQHFVAFVVWVCRSYMLTKDEKYGQLFSVLLNFLQIGVHCKDLITVDGETVEAKVVLRKHLLAADTSQIHPDFTDFHNLLSRMSNKFPHYKSKILSLQGALKQDDHVFPSSLNSSSENKENKMKRKERMAEHRQALIEKMKTQQASFMASIASEDLEEDKVDRKRAKEDSEEDVCIVCLQSTEADTDMVYPYHIVVPPDMSGMRAIKKNTCHAPMSILHASSCCHIIHKTCIEKHIKGKLAQTYYEDDMLVVKENLFQCPLCQNISNCLIKVYTKSPEDVKKSKLNLEKETFPEIMLSALKQNWEKKLDYSLPYSNEIKFVANLNKSQKITCPKIHLQSLVYAMSYTIKSICEDYSFTIQRNIPKDYLQNLDLLIMNVLDSRTPICDSFFTKKFEGFKQGECTTEDSYNVFHLILTWFYCYRAAGVSTLQSYHAIEDHRTYYISDKIQGCQAKKLLSDLTKYLAVLESVLEMPEKIQVEMSPTSNKQKSVQLIDLPRNDLSIITTMTMTHHKRPTCDGSICLCLICSEFICDSCTSVTPTEFRGHILPTEVYADHEFGKPSTHTSHRKSEEKMKVGQSTQTLNIIEAEDHFDEEGSEDEADESVSDTAATFKPRDILFTHSAHFYNVMSNELTKHASSHHNGVGAFLVPETSKVFLCSIQHSMTVYAPYLYKDQFNSVSNCEKTLQSYEYEKMRGMFRQNRMAQLIIDSKQQ